MKNHVSRQVMASAKSSATIGKLRQYALIAHIGHPLFSDAEQLQANHFAHECEDIDRLICWGESVQAEITRREAAAWIVPVYLRHQHALRNTLQQLSPTNFRSHCVRLLASAKFPSLDETDRWVSMFDRLAAARFQSTVSLTLATLLNRQA